MIGNDLVWLRDQKNIGRHADLPLIQRILTPAERLLVQISQDPDRMLWSLWAAKEAAFKAWSRQDGNTTFSPTAFEVVLEPGHGAARVRRGPWSVAVRWTQNPDYVHAVASDGPVASAVERHGDAVEEGAHVRDLACRLAADQGWGAGTIEGRPPVFRGAGAPRPVSLSHDGPYSAAVVPL